MSIARSLAGLAAAFLVAGAVATPPVFDDVPLDEAIARTKDSNRTLVVKATAVWCGPCKRMDATTWVDEDVVAWFEANGLAIEIDVDEERAAAQRLSISAMPTMVAFRGGEEFDRIVGYRDAAGLLEWLGDVQRGERAIDRLRREAGDRAGEDGRVDVRARYDLAKQLVRMRKYDEALDEYLWLWDHMLEHAPSMAGVRGSFMASDMTDLAERHPAAKEAFRTKRDALAARLFEDGGLRGNDLEDWFVLSEVIGDRTAILVWFDRVKEQPDAASIVSRVGFRLRGILVETGRLADLLLVTPDPVGVIRRSAMRLDVLPPPGAGIDEAQIERMQEAMRDSFLREASDYFAAALLADRPATADAILAEVARHVPRRTAIRTFASGSLERRAAHPRMLVLVDEALAEIGEAGEDDAPELVAERTYLRSLRESLALAIERSERERANRERGRLGG